MRAEQCWYWTAYGPSAGQRGWEKGFELESQTNQLVTGLIEPAMHGDITRDTLGRGSQPFLGEKPWWCCQGRASRVPGWAPSQKGDFLPRFLLSAQGWRGWRDAVCPLPPWQSRRSSACRDELCEKPRRKAVPSARAVCRSVCSAQVAAAIAAIREHWE